MPKAPTYSVSTTVQVTGVPQNTLNSWVFRKVFKPSDPEPGAGKERRYSPADICRLKIMQGLTQFFRIGAIEAARIADGALFATSFSSKGKVFKPHCIVVLGAVDHGWEVIDGEQATIGRPDVPVLVLPAGRIVQRVLDELSAIEGDD